MRVVTRINDVRTSTRKIRLVADSLRSMNVFEALDALSVIEKRGANDLKKALQSAISNAVNNSKMDKNNLKIVSLDINEGTSLKRFHPSTRGRIHPYKKRRSNIRIVLEEKVPVQNTTEEKTKETEKGEGSKLT